MISLRRNANCRVLHMDLPFWPVVARTPEAFSCLDWIAWEYLRTRNLELKCLELKNLRARIFDNLITTEHSGMGISRIWKSRNGVKRDDPVISRRENLLVCGTNNKN